MNPLHEPARIIGADRDHHEIEGAGAGADLAELRVIRRVAGEPGAPAVRGQGEPAPERPIAVAQPPIAEVPRRRGGDPPGRRAG
jgi:hypothetical protein